MRFSTMFVLNKFRFPIMAVITAALVFAAGCGGNEAEQAQIAEARAEIERLRAENQELAKLREENEEVQRLRKENQEIQKLRAQYQELVRLRKENEQLRQQLARAQQSGVQPRPPQAPRPAR